MPRGWRGESVISSSVCFLLQDYIFYLEPDKLESGKGKCSYDPKVDTVSALISESCSSLGPALPALGRGNTQARWDNCSQSLPVLPKYPQGVGLLPLPPLPAPAAGGQAPRMPSPWAPGPAEVGSWLQTSANLPSSLQWPQAVALGCLVATGWGWGWMEPRAVGEGGWTGLGGSPQLISAFCR